MNPDRFGLESRFELFSRLVPVHPQHTAAPGRYPTPLEPERRLMVAVLEDAVMCFQNYFRAPNAKKKRLFLEAEEWLTQGESDGIFSFENVCEHLGLDPRYVRAGLLRWKAKQMIKPRREPRAGPKAAKRAARKKRLRVAA